MIVVYRSSQYWSAMVLMNVALAKATATWLDGNELAPVRSAARCGDRSGSYRNGRARQTAAVGDVPVDRS